MMIPSKHNCCESRRSEFLISVLGGRAKKSTYCIISTTHTLLRFVIFRDLRSLVFLPSLRRPLSLPFPREVGSRFLFFCVLGFSIAF